MTAFAWAQSPTIKVEGGMVQGVPSAASGVTVFRGIPYAAPPVGDLRWKRPQPVVKWKGVKVADTFSNICWQPGNAVGTFYGNEFEKMRREEFYDFTSEECLASYYRAKHICAKLQTMTIEDAALYLMIWKE